MDSLKVVHVFGGGLDSGAGRGLLNQHEGLLKLGVDSCILLTNRKSSDGAAEISDYGNGFGLCTRRLVLRAGERLIGPSSKVSRFTNGVLGFNPYHLPVVREADVVNIHWLSGSPTIQAIGKTQKPTVITMRDMWFFTGGCHYSSSCERYLDECGMCRVLNSTSTHDRSHYLLKYKRRMWQDKTTLKAIGISPWVARQATQSRVFGEKPCSYIWNGIDRDHFLDLDQEYALSVLKLDPSFRYVSIGATNFTADYKGSDLLAGILKRLTKWSQAERVRFVFFGNDTGVLTDQVPGSIELGYISDDHILNCLYSASSVFVASSRQEAFGKTIAESLASGTPVVAFRTSGLADMITHGSTGYLANPFEVEDFSSGIIRMVETMDRNDESLRKRCRLRSQLFCHLENARSYRDLYCSLLDSTNGVRDKSVLSHKFV